MDNSTTFMFGYGLGAVNTILIIVLRYWYTQCYREDRNHYQPPINIQPSLSSAIQIQPRPIQDALIIHFRLPEGISASSNCLVCLENMIDKQTIVECTSCHTNLGHYACIEDWFHLNMSCPHCRTNFFLTDK